MSKNCHKANWETQDWQYDTVVLEPRTEPQIETKPFSLLSFLSSFLFSCRKILPDKESQNSQNSNNNNN